MATVLAVQPVDAQPDRDLHPLELAARERRQAALGEATGTLQGRKLRLSHLESTLTLR
jgi:hypothetical protein